MHNYISGGLINAIEEGSLSKVQAIVESGGAAYINTQNNVGFSPLLVAVRAGHLDLAKYLIDKGADVNAKDIRGYTPLRWAVLRGHLDIANCLIDKGADVNEDNDGNTALHEAGLRGHLDLAKYLIDKGADVNAKDNRGYTPLHEAVFRGHLDLAKYLIDKGADVNAKDSTGYTALHGAVLRGHLDIANCLIDKGADVNAKDSTGYTPLRWAVISEKVALVGLLIAARAKVNDRVNARVEEFETIFTYIIEKCKKDPEVELAKKIKEWSDQFHAEEFFEKDPRRKLVEDLETESKKNAAELKRLKEQAEEERSQLKKTERFGEEWSSLKEGLNALEESIIPAAESKQKDLHYCILVHKAVIVLQSNKSTRVLHNKKEALLGWYKLHQGQVALDSASAVASLGVSA